MNKINFPKIDSGKVQFIKSAILGAIATLVELSVIVFLKEIFGLYPIYAAALGNIVYIIINYYGSIKFVFHHRVFENKYLEMTIFVILGLIGLLLYTASMGFFFKLMNEQNYLLACIYASMVVYFWNFFSRKYILFDKTSIKFFQKFEKAE